ncbi:hypothetical protein [Noviluteimonas gilva]|uniref:Uncharacterized protein n=1 Tax=Noviluteimonas gilva TaxID=2682097 RepID=A0A7C9HVK1_9GAMM|nr:hypothetical protein [Lysobacter gilvus]MUV15631.1 hypothetical protein [Lysobacter gilvus]
MKSGEGKNPVAIAPSEKELIALREQNELLRGFQDKLLNTVLWSLGVVVTLTLLLLGFSWFTNKKLYDEDKVALRKEFDEKIEQMQDRVEAALSLKVAENLSVVDAKIQSAVAELRTRVSQVVAQVDAVDARTARLDITLYDLKRVEEWMWASRKVPVNLLITQSQALEIANNVGNKLAVGLTLQRIAKTLNEQFLQKDGPALPAFIRDGLLARLSESAKLDEIAANEVISLVGTIKVEADERKSSEE